ncbi:plasmid related protein [sediment metagenome]|uniref:Plasmid related protein n=1 Tax=sediment metagenome TaxID=749907 RepID=D9PHN6_9ZZZZ
MSTQQQQTQFPLGQIVATPGALEALQHNHTTGLEFLQRHARGDWGDLSNEDRQANDDALHSGARILSSYLLTDETKLWIITEAADESGNRTATTLLLPEEY